MENPFYKRIASALWVFLIILVVTLAAYVSLGRLLTANLAGFRVEILQLLNARLPFGVEAQQVSGQWRSFTPELVLTGLRVSIPGSGSPPLELSRGRVGLDVLNSLRTGSLQMTRLVLDGLSLHGELSPEGEFRLAGFGPGRGGAAGPLREFLLNIERVSLNDNRLLLTMPDGAVRDFELQLELLREGSQRHMQATLVSSVGTQIDVVAQGLGDPFNPRQFSGQGYLKMQSAHLGAMRAMFAEQFVDMWADGTADLELWLNWDRGEPSVQARLVGGDLLVAAEDDSWNLPLDRVALEARLLQRNERWSLFVANLQIENDDIRWALPRLQLDAVNDALLVRTGGFEIEPLNAILTGQGTVSGSLREVFTALHPRGQVSALEIRLGSIDEPDHRWLVAANFEELAVESLHGAPGITAAKGYARIGASGGTVILDGQSISLDFPAIYREPLFFDDLYGTLHLRWDAGSVELDSGLLTTLGEEGVAKVLFGLNIPLQADDIGIEMDLLVGLHDTHPVHRIKYIPYILDPALLTWLGDSIGEGSIEEGAFLWRGSLRSGAAPLRTVQLAFNVANTQLNYHPQWPPVLVQEGVVLIDDGDVSVWADQASLYESRVEALSVETRINPAGDILLDLQGSVHGPVGDGFRVLNQSPLAQVVGPTFAAWTASGQLDTNLHLHINLSDTLTQPHAEVATEWSDVEMTIMPGNLPLRSLNGRFEYSTSTGFNATGLTATLWDKAVSASLSQQHGASGGKYDAATTVVDIQLATQVDMADVRQWLQLESLAFASGQANADLLIRLSPGTPPVLTVNSDLQGVSLDLPQPWQKEAKAQKPLHLETTLAQGLTPLALDLGDELQLRLTLEGAAVRGGAVGVGQPAPPVEEGVLHVSGHLPLLQTDEWFELADRYIGTSGSTGKVGWESPELQHGQDGVDAADDVLSRPQPREQAHAALKVEMDKLRVDSVVVLGQEIRDVVFGLYIDPSAWELNLQTDWLRGDLSSTGAGGSLLLSVPYLDLDGLPEFKQPDSGSDSPWELPRMKVSLENIFQSEKRLGNLGFDLFSQSNKLTVDAVTGQLAHLRLHAEQPARLLWHRGSQSYTEVQAHLGFEDLGETLAYFDYQRIVETRGGDIDVDFRWPGGPQDFQLAETQGSLQLAIGPGNFLQASAGATGAVRVASILNLADIVQRLSLSTMFEEGIPFDSVKGDVEVQDATLTVARMDVEGGSSFRFSGVSNLHSRTLDGQLVATLPVANNLPWIAALAASLPVAAGVFVVSQVFSKQMNRLSSAVYTIGGSWNEPEVKFDRIFDNAPQAPEDVSVQGPEGESTEAVQSAAP